MTNTRGFTLIETMVTLLMIALLIVVVGTLQRQLFGLDRILHSVLFSQREARQTLKAVTAELRSASPSNTGAYPLAETAATSMIFFSDPNDDGLKERIRYFVEGTSLKRGVTTPSGNPLVYNLATEKVTTVVNDIDPAATGFAYFPGTYDGTTPSLPQPVAAEDARLVKITIVVDRDPTKSPGAVTVTSQVTIRNLKDNL